MANVPKAQEDVLEIEKMRGKATRYVPIVKREVGKGPETGA